MTSDPVLDALIKLLIASVGANVLVYWGIVVPALYRNGARFPTGMLPWRYFHEMHAYRQVLAAQGRSTNRYYLILFAAYFTLALGLVVLIYWGISISEPSYQNAPRYPG